MKINKITKLQPGIYAFVCPLCGSVLASASEPDFMPDFSICTCDINGNEKQVFELFEVDGKTMIRRTKYPRFTAEVSFGQLSDIENIKMIDECLDVSTLAKVMRKASEFLLKTSKNGCKR